MDFSPARLSRIRLEAALAVAEKHDLHVGNVDALYSGSILLADMPLPEACTDLVIEEWRTNGSRDGTFRFHRGTLDGVRIEAIERGPLSNVSELAEGAA